MEPYISNLINRLHHLDTSCISDVCSDLRILSNSVKPVNPKLKIAGIAYTVFSEGDIIPVLMGLINAKVGDVLVIDSCGTEFALFGELIATDAKRKMLNGILTNGNCRDVQGIKDSSFPVFARSTCPRVAGKSKVGKLQISLDMDGVRINPGDIIFGDQDGVVVMDPAKAEKIIADAEAVQKMEEEVMRKVASGVPFNDLLNTEEHHNKLMKGLVSEFKFKK